MLRLFCLVALLVGVFAQGTLISQRTYDNCAVVGAGTPCVQSTLKDEVLAQGMSCAVSSDGATLLVSDTQGVQLVQSSDLSSIPGTNSRTSCEYYQALPLEVNGKFLLFQSALGGTDNGQIGSCTCDTPGDCRQRVIVFRSPSIGNVTTVLPVGAQNFNMDIYTVETDVVDAPLVPLRCDVPRPYPWENNQDPNAVLGFLTASTGFCVLDFTSAVFLDAKLEGWKYILRGGFVAGTYPSQRDAYTAEQMTLFMVDGETWPQVQSALLAGENVTVSFGPSFVADSPISANVALGLGTVDVATGNFSSNSTFFDSALVVVQEAAVGGRDNRIWVVGPDNDFSRVLELDVTDPSAPVLLQNLQVDADVVRLNESVCPRWITTNTEWFSLPDGTYSATGTVPFFSDCPIQDPAIYSFAYGFFLSSRLLLRGVGFFQENSEVYAALAYPETFACVGCPADRPQRTYIDLWRVSDTPPTRIQHFFSGSGLNLDTTSIVEEVVIASGLLFYTDTTQSSAITFWFSVSSAGVSTVGSGMFNDTALPSDVIVTRRQLLPQNRLLVNFGKYGTVIYDFDSTGILGVNTRIPAFSDPSAESDGSGVQQLMCGSASPLFYRFNNLASTGSPGFFESSTLEAWSLSSASSTSTSSTSSSSASTSSTTSSTSTTSTGGSSAPTSTPTPSAPACPEFCKYDCSYIEPSKVPKPSVKPSKAPAATKVPEQQYFIIELTYESTASECGADAPTCCEIQDWLGDDSVAASFYMCSSDSQTKDRAPSYDSKAGTCSIFLAAAEGSDAGEISQAEFDAAVATLEGNFNTLCPMNVKNCDISTQSGKNIDYIIGGGAGSVAVSVLILIVVLMIGL